MDSQTSPWKTPYQIHKMACNFKGVQQILTPDGVKYYTVVFSGGEIQTGDPRDKAYEAALDYDQMNPDDRNFNDHPFHGVVQLRLPGGPIHYVVCYPSQGNLRDRNRGSTGL